MADQTRYDYQGVRPIQGPKLGLWIHVTLFDDTVRLMTPNSMEATWPKITHLSFTSALAMDADDSPGEWSSSDEVGIHGGRVPARQVQGQLRPARSPLSFVSLVDFDPEENYDENPPSYIRYGLEWTLRLNQKKIAFQTEPDVVLAPSDFWNHTLRSNLENELSKLHQKQACQAETTTVTVSVNARGEEDLTRRFDGLGTTWSVVEERLRRWSRLLLEGKKIRIKVVFDYTDTDRSARASGVGRGATASQLAERSVRLDAEQAASGSPDPWRQVYGICRCPGSPCDRGPYCFQDPETKKHYKLLGHHLRQLVKVVQTGGHFHSHGDMPQDIRNALYAEEQQQSNRKRKRGDQESQQTVQQPVIINNYIPTHGNQSSTAPQQLPTHQRPELETLDIPGMRDDAVIEYCAWHCTKVRRQQLREQYQLARDLTLEAGLDLELVYEDSNPAFLTDLGVFEGVARRWVRDVKIFLEQYIAF